MSQVTAIISRIIMNSEFNVSFYDNNDNLVITLETATFVEVVGTYLVCGDSEGNSCRFFANTITLIEGPDFSQTYIPLPAGFYQQDQDYFNRLSQIYTFISSNVVNVVIRSIDALEFSDGTTQTTAATGGGGSGTVTSVGFTAGTGITVGGTNPITTSGSVTITNSAPDQTVVLNNGTGISTSGTYPNFTITNTAPDQTVALTSGTGISTSGTYPNFTIANTAPDQTVVLNSGTGIGVTGAYPNFTITNSSPSSGGTVTSVGLTAGSGISIGGTSPITTSGSLSVTNTAPDQTVVLNNGTGISVTGTYPNFTITNTGTSSPLTTKGDLYTRNGSADARLPVGLDTQVLLADSTAATGLKWGSNTTPPASGYYGAWQDNNTQSAPSSNVGVAMIFRSMDLSNGVSVVTNGTNLTRITFANTGIYNLQFSSQFQNSANTDEDVTIWLRLNGSDVAGSSGFVSIPSKHGSVVGHTVTSWNYLLSVVAGQYYELIWSTSNHTAVTMEYYPAGSPPPSTASVILTVTQQAGIMAGTGITAINSLIGAAQTLATGTTGTDFGISSSGTTHTFNIPTASASNRGVLSSTDWSTFNGKQNSISLTISGTSGPATLVGSTLNIPQYAGSGTGASNYYLGGSATGLAAGATRYGSVAGTTAESQVRIPTSSACTISDLYVRTTATMNASASLAVTIFKNGSSTALTLTIAGGSAAGTYSNTANSVTLAAGDGWTFGFTNAGSATAAASSGQSVKITI